MTRRLLIHCLVVVLLGACVVRGAESAVPATVVAAQAEAAKKYPQLTQTGSELNKAYVARFNQLRAQNTDYFKDPAWPLKLADEVAVSGTKSSGQTNTAPLNPVAAKQPVTYAAGVELAHLANKRIKESSGIACSRTNPGIFWTHNDSGAPPEFFAFNEKGEDLGSFIALGASSTDWEDVAVFTLDKRNFLIFGDTGDNAVARKNCTLYILAEPKVAAHAQGQSTVPLAASIQFTYEDGPHNCETLMTDTARKEVILISKTTTPECKAYVIPLKVNGHTSNAKARPIATLHIPTTTGGDISPDNLRAIITTYGDAYEYTRTPAEDWAAAFAREPRIIPLPKRKKGEAICYGPDGKTLYLTSETYPCPLLKVPPAN